MHIAGVIYCLGWTAVPLSTAMLLPAVAALVADDLAAAESFIGSTLLGGFASGLLVLAGRRRVLHFDHFSAYIYLGLVWPFLALIGALPFVFGEFPGSFLNQYFEAVSAVTTTGTTALPPGYELPAPMLLWRGLLQWLGGFLTVVLTVVIFFELGVGGMRFFQSALPRGEAEALPARIFMVARNLGWIYLLATFLFSAAFWAAGVSALGGLGLAMAALSTGGFTMSPGFEPVLASFLGQLLMALFLLVGSINLTVLWSSSQGRMRPLLHDAEFRYFALFFAAAAASLAIWLFAASSRAELAAIADGFAAAAALISTSGLSGEHVDLSAIPPVAVIVLLLIGGCAGSSAGGLKVFRIVVLFKQAKGELARLSHPHGVVSLKARHQDVDDALIFRVWSLFLAFVSVLAIASIVLAGCGLTPIEAIGVSVASLANAGPIAEVLVPLASETAMQSAVAKVTIMIVMVLGRLEILPVIALLNPAFWRR